MSEVIESITRGKTGQETFVINYFTENLGLARHVTSAISNVLKYYDRVIVVEDDIKLSSNFYKNMVQAFRCMQVNQIEGTIGAFSPILLSSIFAKFNKWRVTYYFSCWGWDVSKDIWKNSS
jgi:hypothetical protein